MEAAVTKGSKDRLNVLVRPRLLVGTLPVAHCAFQTFSFADPLSCSSVSYLPRHTA